MERREFLGLVGIGCLVSTLPELTSIALSQPVPLFCDIDVKILPPKTQKILEDFKRLSIYHKNIAQDNIGRGISSCQSLSACDDEERRNDTEDHRSEQPAYLPFVLSPRRQTDSLVRQGYNLLPESVRKDKAFLIADRLAQYPECYIPYIQKKKNIVIIGSFSGLGHDEKKDNPAPQTMKDETGWRKDRHTLELAQLELAIKLVKSLNKRIVDVVYAMGDTSVSTGQAFRQDMERHFHEILSRYKLEGLQRPLSWGADEAVWIAFARQLPSMTIKVNYENGEATQFYDGKVKAKDLFPNLLNELKMTEAIGDTFDAQAFVFNRYLGAYYDDDQVFLFDNPRQKEADEEFISRRNIRSLSPEQQAKSIIIDVRNYNGALNKNSIPPSDKFLAFGAWGTFGNVVGQTLAIAKILHFALENARSLSERQRLLKIQRQLLLEAIAHDVFVIGYEQVQGENSKFKDWRRQNNLQPTNFNAVRMDRKNGVRYRDSAEVQQVYQQIENFVNEQMPRLAPQLVGTTRFKIVPQIWRTFESQVYASDGELSYAGVYRTDLPEGTFNPLKAVNNVKVFNLQDLINEFPSSQ